MHPLLPAGYLVHAQISIKVFGREDNKGQCGNCLLYTSDAADE